jgi:methionine biosynthesis protein MetW
MNIIKKIKFFLFSIKKDLKSLNHYPSFQHKGNFSIDYDKYWHKRRGDNYQSKLSSWQKERADYVINFFEDGDVIVDIGGGDGEVLNYIKNKINIKGVCIDFNDIVLNEARKKNLETIKLDLAKIEELDKMPDCDYIIGFEILEHMSNPEEFIFKVKSKVRKSMIFSFPNSGYYLHRLRLLFGKFPLQWVSHPGEHLRFWTAGDVKWWVKSMGLNLDDLKLYQGLPFLNKIFPKFFGQGIIIKISK